jgi:hypothetical protein
LKTAACKIAPKTTTAPTKPVAAPVPFGSPFPKFSNATGSHITAITTSSAVVIFSSHFVNFFLEYQSLNHRTVALLPDNEKKSPPFSVNANFPALSQTGRINILAGLYLKIERSSNQLNEVFGKTQFTVEIRVSSKTP